MCERLLNTFNHRVLARPLTSPLLSSLSADRNELEAAQKFLEQAAIENLVSMEGEAVGAQAAAGEERTGAEDCWIPPAFPPSSSPSSLCTGAHEHTHTHCS